MIRHDRVEGLYLGVRGGLASGGRTGLRAAGEAGYAGAAGLLLGEAALGVGRDPAAPAAGPGVEAATVPARAPRPGWFAGVRAWDAITTRDAWRTGDAEAALGSALIASDPRDYVGARGIAIVARTTGAAQRAAALEFRHERVRPVAARGVWNPGERPVRANPAVPGQLRRYLHADAAMRWGDAGRGGRLVAAADLPVTRMSGAPPLRSAAASLELRLVRRPGEGWRGAARIRAAACGPSAPPDWHDALGGVDALRGLAFKELRGRRTLLASMSVLDAGAILGATRIPLLDRLGMWCNAEWGTAGGRGAGSFAMGAGDLGGLARVEVARRATSRHAPIRTYLRLAREI